MTMRSVFLRAFFFLFAAAGGKRIKYSIEYWKLWGRDRLRLVAHDRGVWVWDSEMHGSPADVDDST